MSSLLKGVIMKTELMGKLYELEIKLEVYSTAWGPDSEEVKVIEHEISRINEQILDLMVS